jgi:NAD(P)-dependent dehydrogenase (short-subunit alcohol dehydrogenase family)
VTARTVPRSHLLSVAQADLSQPDDVERLAQHVLDRCGGIDILISHVGGQILRARALEFSDEDWKSEVAINLLAMVRLGPASSARPASPRLLLNPPTC